MSDMKCPFCQQPIVCMDAQDADEHSTWYCPRCIAEKAWYAFGNDKLWQALIDTKKKLDICIKALNKIANTDIKVIEREPRYYARAMFSVTNNALCRIQDIDQSNEITQNK